MFKICSIGCGAMAQRGHGPAYAKYKKDYPGTVLAACCDINEDRAKKFSEDFGFEAYYTDYIKMLEETNPDVVCLLSPVDLTCPMAVEMIKKGFNIIVEKPPGKNCDEVLAILKAAQENGVNVRTAFNRRYTPLITELKKRIAETGEKIINITYQMYRWHRYDNDFSTTAIHAVDAVKYIASSDYKRVTFDYDFRSEYGENVKNIFINGEFENGVFTQISLVPVGGVVTERLTVNTHANTFFVDLPVWGNIDVPGKLTHIANGREITVITGDMLSDSSEMFELCGFYDENRCFFEHIRHKNETTNDLESAIQSVEIEDYIRKSKTLYKA